MEIGAFVPLSSINTTPALVRALGPALEERGFESVWVPEHVVLFDEYDSQYPYDAGGRFPGGGDIGLLEPFSALTYLAAVTDTLRLGTGICLVPQRNPVYTAKQVADLDVLSGGRVELGIGVGWLREEYDALGVPFERRGARARDNVGVMKALWTEEVSSYDGELYTLPPCRFSPKPVQRPHPPIHGGGETDVAMRRAVTLGQGWFGFNRLPDEVPEALTRLDRILAEHERARADFTVTVCPYFKPIDADAIRRYEDLGVDRIVVVALPFTVDDLEPTLDAVAQLVPS